MIFRYAEGRAPRVHICGIGGTAMVAGARLAIEAGWEVRGSDNPLYPPTSDMVKALGVRVYEGYAASNLDWEPDLVVIGDVLSRGHEGVEAVLDRGLPYVSLPEWMKDVVLRARRPVAICGTHGKTTTTALAAYLLDRCGMDPGYFIGGQPLCFEHSARLGPEGAPFVIEGDEYDTAFFDKRAKFFHYVPEIAVVTSIEFDHGDIYPSLDDITIAFQRMLRQIPRSGWLIACADDAGARALTEHAPCNVATYGLGDNAQYRGEIVGQDGAGQHLRVTKDGAPLVDTTVPLVGEHNIRNAIAAVVVADILGAEATAIEASLPTFAGIRRRMEIFHEANGVIFVDDFAHHPTAIRETIAAAKKRWPDRPLTVLFEPRSNTTVTNTFHAELVEAFALGDRVWLGPIYRSERIAEETRLDRANLVATLEERGTVAGHTDDTAEILQDLTKNLPEDAVVLILSNGAFDGIYQTIRETFRD